MNALTPISMRHVRTASRSPIHEFVEKNWPALQNAAALIGGRRGAQQVDRLFDDLSQRTHIQPTTQRRLDRLIRLLELNDDCISETFLLIDVSPSNPVVAEICLLADGLRDASIQGSSANRRR